MKPSHLFLFWLTFSTILLAITINEVFGEHLTDIDLDIHPDNRLYYQIHDIHITEVWIQLEEDYIPFEEKCAIGFSLTTDGQCTPSYQHWHIYPLYIVQVMPEECNQTGCVLLNDKGIAIYILQGHAGDVPTFGGCSVLWHEIMHIKLGFKDETYEHQEIAKRYPNERCAV